MFILMHSFLDQVSWYLFLKISFIKPEEIFSPLQISANKVLTKMSYVSTKQLCEYTLLQILPPFHVS